MGERNIIYADMHFHVIGRNHEYFRMTTYSRCNGSIAKAYLFNNTYDIKPVVRGVENDFLYAIGVCSMNEEMENYVL